RLASGRAREDQAAALGAAFALAGVCRAHRWPPRTSLSQAGQPTAQARRIIGPPWGPTALRTAVAASTSVAAAATVSATTPTAEEPYWPETKTITSGRTNPASQPQAPPPP